MTEEEEEGQEILEGIDRPEVERVETLNKEELLKLYVDTSEKETVLLIPAFIRSLKDEDEDPNELDLIILGNHKLNFSSRVTDPQLKILCNVLQGYAHMIENVDLKYNHIHDEGAMYLADLLRLSPELKYLDLSGNSIEVKGAQILAEVLKESEQLMYLNLNGNFILTEGSMSITELLFTNLKLMHLDIGNNELDHDGMIALSSVINCSNYTLEVLNIDNPRYKTIGQETAIHFGKMVANNVGLQKLSMRKHKLRCDGTYVFMEHLLENTTLKVLDLNANEIGPQGMSAIGKYLKQESCSLESMHMGNNRAGDLGGKAIAQALAINKSLIHIDLTYNSINDDGLSRLAESLFHNQSLLSFKFFGNTFNQSCLALYYELLRNRERENGWAPDFIVYLVDEHYDMAYIETKIGLDIYV